MEKSYKKPHKIISGSKDPELFFGVVGAVGADLDVLCKALEDHLTRVSYSSKIIHVIEQIHQFQKWKSLPEKPLEDRYTSHISAGDNFREAFELGDALARLSIAVVREKYRKPVSANNSADEPISRCAYILRSLKHPREVKLLRDVYGPNFFLLAAYSPHDIRLKEFTRRIAATHHSTGQGAAKYGSVAASILDLDQAEPDKRMGQNLRETFPLADLFINVTNKDIVDTDVSRFIDLLFYNTEEINTPSRDEYGMFLARAAALRSAALGRQVGAAISTDNGDIIALGTNDVPNFGGGLYWPGQDDHRDYKDGKDTSDEMKRVQFAEILERLQKHGWFSGKRSKADAGDLVTEALPLVKSTRLMSLIEFGRCVHAEMAALLDAAARGVAIKNCTMYTTTFPCHDCARHIVASGIKRVAYIEPYPKSLALEFHKDSIIVDPHEETARKVRFEQFVGIAPTRYLDLFTANERKGLDGRLLKWDKSRALPRYAQSVLSYIYKEKDAVAQFEIVRKQKGIHLVQ